MQLKKSNCNAIWPYRNEFHILTYAEEGFAPLNEHTKNTGVTKEELVAFANTVNRLNQTGTLYPKAHVSAVPRPLIRDGHDAYALCHGLLDFYKINAVVFKSRKILLDFRTPNVEVFIEDAIELSLRSSVAVLIEELIVIDDNAV